MIDSLTIYCLATGKPIASYCDEETGFILDSLVDNIAVSAQPAHLERLALMSMRPSLAWMSVTPDSLNQMMSSYSGQLQVLAYLMNRMYHPIETDRFGKPLNHAQWLAARRNRIAMWESIESTDIEQDKLDKILYVLLNIDSRYSLTKIVKPASIIQVWDSWSADGCDKFITDLWAWDSKLQQAADEAARRAKFQAEFWSEGNRLSRQALVTSFTKVKPPTVATVERRAKNAKLADAVDFLNQLERELSGGPASEAVAVVRLATPKAKFKFTKFGSAA